MAYRIRDGKRTPLETRFRRSEAPRTVKITVEDVKEARTKLSNPLYFGPGRWSDLHKYALYCALHRKFDNYVEYAKFILSTLECKKCRDHAAKNLKHHPIENFRDLVYNKPGSKFDGKILDCFLWSVVFHNTVNRQLGKPEMSTEAALQLHDSEVIDEACDIACAFTPPTTTYPSYPM